MVTQTDHPGLAALGQRLVVKLADIPHRTEVGAVRTGVTPDQLATVVAEMRAIAAAHGVSDVVAVQAMVAGHAEAFGGVKCRTGLGPVVLLGLGGVLVEVAGQVGGRFLPLDDETAADLADEVAGPGVIGRLRGQRPGRSTPSHRCCTGSIDCGATTVAGSTRSTSTR